MLSTSLKRRVEKVLRLLDRLAKESAKGTPIIVEGRKDVNTLRDLAIKGDIISAKTSGRSLLDVLVEVEKRSKHEVILLMDFDRRGKEWTKHLTQHFEKMRIKPNLFFWKGLLSLVGRDVRDIEGLATYLENLKKKCGNRI
ncbi:toprim domain-containing protein [Candidatus Bathyarchaeota archaeon]|nr:MAG: toprim domain-containing protein [Candidatus Bathyarchaeota archaeon]